MALIYCPECGKQISDSANACPQCGFPLQSRIPSLFSSDVDSRKTQYDAIGTLLSKSKGVDAKLLVEEFRSITSVSFFLEWGPHNYERIAPLATLDNISRISENPEQDYERLKPLIEEFGNMSLGNSIKMCKKENGEIDSVTEFNERKDGKTIGTFIQIRHREYKDKSKSVTIRFYNNYIACIEYFTSNSLEITYENLECMNQEQGFLGMDTKGNNVKYDLSSIQVSVYNTFVDELEKRGILQNENLRGKIKKSNVGNGTQTEKSNNVTGTQHEERTASVNTATESSGHHYSIFHKREKVSHDVYMFTYGMRCVKALCDRKKEYLAAFEGRDDFFELENAYNELPRLYNQYVSSILSTQLKMTSPISPYAAAALGTFVGGAAVGVVAAADAKEKQKNVADNNKRAMEIEGKQTRSRTSLNDCYECVERYILQNKATAEDWKRQLNFIAQEMNYEYKIRR